MQEQEIIAHIKSLCGARGWTLYRLAKESGITYSTLCTMLHKATAPSIPTLVKLCKGFGITLSEFFDINNETALLPKEQKDLLVLWNSLNLENKQTVEKYMIFLLENQTQNKTKNDPR